MVPFEILPELARGGGPLAAGEGWRGKGIFPSVSRLRGCHLPQTSWGRI